MFFSISSITEKYFLPFQLACLSNSPRMIDTALDCLQVKFFSLLFLHVSLFSSPRNFFSTDIPSARSPIQPIRRNIWSIASWKSFVTVSKARRRTQRSNCKFWRFHWPSWRRPSSNLINAAFCKLFELVSIFIWRPDRRSTKPRPKARCLRSSKAFSLKWNRKWSEENEVKRNDHICLSEFDQWTQTSVRRSFNHGGRSRSARRSRGARRNHREDLLWYTCFSIDPPSLTRFFRRGTTGVHHQYAIDERYHRRYARRTSILSARNDDRWSIVGWSINDEGKPHARRNLCW